MVMNRSVGGAFRRTGLLVPALIVALAGSPAAGAAQEEAEETLEYFETPNTAGVFVGVTVEPADRGSGASFTLGVDYERRVAEYVGIGAFAEGAFGNTEREALLGVSLIAHPHRGLLLVLAPLVEISQPRGGDSEAEIGIRFALEYEISASDRYLFVPTAAVDFVQSDVMLVLGLSAALRF